MYRRFCMAAIAATLCLNSLVGIAAERLVVYTVNYPLQYFAQRIAGDHAQVVLPVPPDVDPAFWQPDAETIGHFQRADIILLNGAGYAKWVNRVSLPRRKLVDTSAGFRDRYIETQGGGTHSHGREGDHSHAGVAFTTWLDLGQAVQQARAVHDALSRHMPDQANTFTANFHALERDLQNLDARLEAITARNPEQPLFASHPVYQYLARRYSLNLESMMWEPDAMPPESEWQTLARLRKGHPATWMLWEGEPVPAIRDRLQQSGVQSIVFVPCGNHPETGDFLSAMSNNISNMEQIFGHRSSPQ
jgi:zinc transport system substrate-binding protein